MKRTIDWPRTTYSLLERLAATGFVVCVILTQGPVLLALVLGQVAIYAAIKASNSGV